MNETTEIPEDIEAPELPSEPAPPIQSRFLFVDVAALRAKQLRRGARVRFDAEGTHKAERVAMEEVRRGLVQYNVPPPPPRTDGEPAAARGPRSTPRGAA
jgi:DNA-directed RNA polymerase omega subunit